MNAITNEAQYIEAVEVFKKAYDDPSISNEEKIRLAELFSYCDYVKGSGRIDCSIQVAELYFNEGYYHKVISYILQEFRSHFENEDDWFNITVNIYPSHMLYAIEAAIEIKDFEFAKGLSEALFENRTANLKLHPNDGLTEQCKFWCASTVAKLMEIAIIENDFQTASHYLNDFEYLLFDGSGATPMDFMFYAGIVFMNDTIPENKKVDNAIVLFDSLVRRGVHDSDTKKDIEMIAGANYYLGIICATEPNYKNKSEAIRFLKSAQNLGYTISDEEIERLTSNISDESKSENNSSTTPTSSSKSGGCYVATCVYGSYDCPPVWTLRRYRDNCLSLTWYGRLFIMLYYAISPTVVKLFGKYTWFHKLFKRPLDHWVKKLNKKGLTDRPYNDKKI